MDSDRVFKKYLETWPDAWITWPKKGQEKIKNFFHSDPNNRFKGKEVFDDFLDFINIQCTGSQVDYSALSCSDWLQKYFKSVRGRELAKKHLEWHEPRLAIISFNVPPLKEMMDGYIKYFIENREVLYGNKL